MSSNSKVLVLGAAGLLVLGVVGAGWLWISADSSRPTPAPVVPSAGGAVSEPRPVDVPEPTRLVAADPNARVELPTTVAHPLEVELDLVRARDLPKADKAPPLGSGATARLQGAIHDHRGAGVRAEVRFEHGANAGRVLYSDGNGKFGANDLQPGLSIVRVRGEGVPGSLREVLLRRERDSLLNIGYGRLAPVEGEVLGASGKGIEGARVVLDGQVAETDFEGVFRYSGVASGKTFVTVQKPGFAAVREELTITMAQRIDRGRLKYVLEPGARLRVDVPDVLNREQQAHVYVLPEVANSQRKYPWHLVQDVRVWPGGTAIVEDLPPGTATVRLFHAGAKALPAAQNVALVRGETQAATFHLEPAPVVVGVVTDGGKPAVGATVRLEAPDRAQAMLGVLANDNHLYLESEVFPDLPPAAQETVTNAKGEYVLSANAHVAPVRYLIATSSDGRRTATAAVREGDTNVALVLKPIAEGTGEIILVMPGRWQPLPTVVTVNGVPRDEFRVPAGQDLHITELPAGTWSLSTRWHGIDIQKKAPVVLDRETTLQIQLPEGAIHGAK
jgi:hypothetical protein